MPDPTYSYDPTTQAGQVRLLAADADTTDATSAIFSDQEIAAFLSLKGNNVFEAAALAYETIARTRGRLSKVMLRNKIRNERYALAELLACAQACRNAGLTGTLQTGDITSGSNEFLDQFRPTWRGLIDPPVVE